MTEPTIADRLACWRYHDEQMRTPRAQEPGRLLRHGFKVYSQNDEDGIIAEIFRRIGPGGRRFVEFGTQHGLETNTTYLLMTGWSGKWLECSPKMAAEVRRQFGELIEIGRLDLVEEKVTAENADDLIPLADGAEIDFLSIDIDFNDHWVWKALTARPRVVAIEYNADLRPPVSLTVPYDPDRSWNGASFYGASLKALEKLGREKGYSLVGCCFSGVNAFFVRDDLVGDAFCAPFTAENHYEPPRYVMRYPVGHFPGGGVYEEV